MVSAADLTLSPTKPNTCRPTLQVLRGVPGLGAGPAVEVDQRGELARLAADDRHHQRQPEQAGPDERFGRAADPDPDRQRVAAPGRG